MSSDKPVQGEDSDPVIPIDELVINGPISERFEAPKLLDGRLVLGDGTQLEMTDKGGRLLDCNGDKIQPHRPFQTKQGLFIPSVNLEVWNLVNQSSEFLDEESFWQEEE